MPRRADITNSPGTKLAYRLPMETSPGWAVFGTLLLCLACDGAAAILLWWAIHRHLSGRPDWIFTLSTIPVCAAGVFLLVFFFRKLLVSAGIAPTLLEISDHPLLPGGDYRVYLSQPGRLKVGT